MKVGDRIKAVEDFDYSTCSFVNGETGTIVIQSASPDCVGVRWDRGQPGMHDCENTCPDRHGYHVPKRYLQVICKDEKMEKPKTQLEKAACKEAIEATKAAEISKKKATYESLVKDFVMNERHALDYRKRADDLKDALGLTEADIKQMI